MRALIVAALFVATPPLCRVGSPTAAIDRADFSAASLHPPCSGTSWWTDAMKLVLRSYRRAVSASSPPEIGSATPPPNETVCNDQRKVKWACDWNYYLASHHWE